MEPVILQRKSTEWGFVQMNDILYLECRAGISGDMFVAALLDLGADQTILMKALNSLPIKGFHVTIGRVKKAGLDVCDFSVHLDAEHENHDYDMEYLHGKGDDLEEHHHKEMGHHHHEHRGLKEIFAIIDQGEMTEHAKQIAKRIFQILGEAEAKAHGVAEEQVHFHEVGAVDSIVDIVAAAVCIDCLKIQEVIVPQLNEGKGWVRCQHGILPIPVPAVANIVAAHHLPLHIMDREGEFVTPTGAAIVAAIQTSDILPQQFQIKKIGLGAGKRNYEIPSLIRAMRIDTGKSEALRSNSAEHIIKKDEIYKLETNIDDCNGEMLGYAMERLLEAGARDVYYHPIYMKKNRPAYQLNVICDEVLVKQLEQIIFEETTTIGIRKIKMERSILRRAVREIKLEYGTVKVKQCEFPSETRYYPEYESVAALSRAYQVPYPQMYQKVNWDCRKKLEEK